MILLMASRSVFLNNISMSQVMSLHEYMQHRKKMIDRYVQGEHAWFGNTDASYEGVTVKPWWWDDKVAYSREVIKATRTP